MTARLRNLDGLATVTDSTASWGDIPPGQEMQGDALVFVPSSTAAKLLLVVSDQYGERLRQTLDLVYPATPTGLLGIGAASSISLTWAKARGPGPAGLQRLPRHRGRAGPSSR